MAASTGTVYTGPSPGTSSAYQQYAAQANQAYQDALNQISQQRTQLLNQSGWQAQYDPSGNITGYSVANNPTGTYQQMLHGLADQGNQEQALQASGLGFSGGVANHMANEQHYQDSLATTNWSNALLGNLSDLNNQQLQATDTYNSGLANEQLNLLNSNISNGLFNPAQVPPVTPKTPGGRTIYGYGVKGNPFFSKAAAIAAGRLGKGKARVR